MRRDIVTCVSVVRPRRHAILYDLPSKADPHTAVFVPTQLAILMMDPVVDNSSGAVPHERSFEDAKSTLYGTISARGAALESAARRRKSTVTAMKGYLDRLKLDVSGLSVIHVTGTKGKGSTCAFVESVLRRQGYNTGLFTSPHLLEVTERVRLGGKPLSKEAFAKYFFDVWDRLQATRQGEESQTVDEADMPSYFHLLTLVGLWCFVREGVDVCVIEVGMGGRYDATNVILSPVVCGVAMLDLDHTQVLGDTLDKIAWEKGGIFKEGCKAFTVEQPRGGMSVLRECAEHAHCNLEVVEPLAAVDSVGRANEIGLAGEHQKVNAGLALRLCAVWMAEAQQQHQPWETFLTSNSVHLGLSECAWPGRCQVVRCPRFPLLTVYLDGAHTEQSVHACLQWFADKTSTATSEVLESAGVFNAAQNTNSSTHAVLGDAERGGKIPRFDKQGSGQEKQQPQQRHRSNRSRRMRVLWFYASHERDMLSLLDMLASARAPHQSECNRTGHPHIDDDSGAASMNEGVDAAGNDADDCNVGADRHDAPLFDMACFMEVIPGRPSRFMLPTATEILARHGVACVPFDSPEMVQAEADVGSDSKECQVKETMQGVHGGGDETTKESTREGVGERNEESTVPGAWQRTLQQVWVSLRARGAAMSSNTRIGTAPELLRIAESIAHGSRDYSGGETEIASASSRRATSETDGRHGTAESDLDGQRRSSGEVAKEGSVPRDSDRNDACGGGVEVDILCTGSLYAVAAALEALGAEVA